MPPLQVLGFDMNLLFEEVYLQNGLLLRGLAHPSLMLDNSLKVCTCATCWTQTLPPFSPQPSPPLLVLY